MDSEKYTSLVELARVKLNQLIQGDRSIEPAEIVNEIYLKLGDAGIEEYRKEIVDYIYSQKRIPKSVPIDAISKTGIVFQRRLTEEEFKQCKKCKETKSINEFSLQKRKDRADCHLSRCRRCTSARMLEYYYRKREHILSLRKKYLTKHKKEITLFYIKRELTKHGRKVKDLTQEMLQKKYYQLHGGVNHRRGEKHHNAKLTTEKVIEIKKLLLQGLADEDIAKTFNINKWSVHNIRHKTTWRWLAA